MIIIMIIIIIIAIIILLLIIIVLMIIIMIITIIMMILIIINNNKQKIIIKMIIIIIMINNKFTNVKILAVSRQYFNCMHSEDFNSSISLLSQNYKLMLARAFQANKSFLIFSMKSCGNCFLNDALQIWNRLPNVVTGPTNFNSFYSKLIKFVFITSVCRK